MSTQRPRDQYINVGQVNTRFRASGDEGTTVLLIHGIGDSVETWMLNINSLAEHHRVYALDLVGFGRSDKPAVPYSLAYGAQFVNDFMEAQRIDQATLIGNSMGGAVSLQFAIQFPDKLEKLVLEASLGLGKEINLLFRLPTLPVIGELLTRPSRKGTTKVFKEILYDPALVTDELVELYYQLSALPGAQKSFLSALRAGVNFWGVRPEVVRSIVDNLGTITAPTLVIWGRQDRILPVAHAEVAKSRTPNAHLHILDSCGHGPHFERPAEFNATVIEFLAT